MTIPTLIETTIHEVMGIDRELVKNKLMLAQIYLTAQYFTSRLDHNADGYLSVAQYYATRALQLASFGYMWTIKLDFERQSGAIFTSFMKDGVEFDSFYILDSFRGRGLGGKCLASCENVIVTMNDCHIEDFLKKNDYPYVIIKDSIFDQAVYMEAEALLGDKTDAFGFLMEQIDFGLIAMHQFGATMDQNKAFCRKMLDALLKS